MISKKDAFLLSTGKNLDKKKKVSTMKINRI